MTTLILDGFAKSRKSRGQNSLKLTECSYYGSQPTRLSTLGLKCDEEKKQLH